LLGLSGREMFTFNPDLITADDDDADEDNILIGREDDIDEEEDADQEGNEEHTTVTRKPAIRDLNENSLGMEAREVDNSGTIVNDDRFDYLKKIEKEKHERRKIATVTQAQVAEENKLDQASGGGGASASACSNFSNGDNNHDDDNKNDDDNDDDEVDIDEDLFNDDDMSDIEEELKKTTLT